MFFAIERTEPYVLTLAIAVVIAIAIGFELPFMIFPPKLIDLKHLLYLPLFASLRPPQRAFIKFKLSQRKLAVLLLAVPSMVMDRSKRFFVPRFGSF